jgi:Ca2+-binding EF-hand superfamily protein
LTVCCTRSALRATPTRALAWTDADGNGNIDYNELTEALKQSMGDSVEPLEVRKLICVANGKLTDEVTDEAVLAFDESVLCVDLFAFGSVMKQAAKVQKQEAYPVEASK